MKDDFLWLIIIVGIIIVGALGGFRNSGNGLLSLGISPSGSTSSEQNQGNLEQQISSTQYQVNQLQQQVQAEQDKKNASVYKGIVSIRYINRSTDASQEYIVLNVSGNMKGSIDITGWTLTSTSTGMVIKIPKSTYLFFAGQSNPENDVYVESGDTVYINTGYSPNGFSFKVNKCSGYLSQFQSWNPGLPYTCPAPRNEDLSSIPQTVKNDDCLDYIQSFPQCRIQTETLPLNWSYECTNFIYSKINYPSCVDTHKNDNDFYQHEWRIYLKRTDHIWKSSKENVTLYDNVGKVVDTYRY